MKKRIEYSQLRAMGCTPAALDFYSNTDPLEIYERHNGTFQITGALEAVADDENDLIRILDDCASECVDE